MMTLLYDAVVVVVVVLSKLVVVVVVVTVSTMSRACSWFIL